MILKLGLDAAQTDLPTKSFSLIPYTRSDNNRRAVTANNSKHIDYTAVKTDLTLNWEILSQEDFALLDSIYQTQVSSLEDLVFTYEDSLGLHSYVVYMPAPSTGNTLFLRGFVGSVSITLEEK